MKLYVLLRWDKTPRAWFAKSEIQADVRNTYPPNRGIWFRMQTLSLFPASAARGVLQRTVRTLEKLFEGNVYA